jgi:membrane protein YdbS with pleckstrin-like domain
MASAAVGVVALSAAAVVAAVVLLAAGAPALVLAAPTALLLAGGALATALPRFAYRHWRYGFGADTLVLHHGVVFRTESTIPYFRVQHVDIERGPIERALGLSRLIVRTASATTDASIPGLAEADAAGLRQLILERAGRGDAV